MRWVCFILAAAGLVLAGGCNRRADVVVYTSVDRDVAEPIIKEFERRTGLVVKLQTDTEATRTAGLAERLMAEKGKPSADVWWGNEMFHTIRLAEAGVLEPYTSSSAQRIADQYKDTAGRWAGNGLRVRLIAVSTTARIGKIRSIEDLTRPELKDRICMARPTAGTTGTQVAALYTLWGPKKTEEFFRALKANGMRMVGGNSDVAQYVANGQMWAGLTDNDDVSAAQREGGKLEAVIPDQQPGGIGTLAMPTTLGLVHGAPDAQAARKLVDYLLSEDVEKKLIEAKFAEASVSKGADGQVVTMKMDYTEAARNLPAAVQLVLKILEGR